MDAFKYRAKDAWRAVTRIAVREARLKEIKQEIFNCQKLKVCLNFIMQTQKYTECFVYNNKFDIFALDIAIKILYTNKKCSIPITHLFSFTL